MPIETTQDEFRIESDHIEKEEKPKKKKPRNNKRDFKIILKNGEKGPDTPLRFG